MGVVGLLATADTGAILKRKWNNMDSQTRGEIQERFDCEEYKDCREAIGKKLLAYRFITYKKTKKKKC